MDSSTKIQPVFIIGAARSGTKFLRSCLSVSDDVNHIPYDINYIWRYGNEDAPDDELLAVDVRPEIKTYISEVLFKLVASKKQNAGYLVEKTVSNSLRVSFINAIFPDAKFVLLTRDGRAVIESATRQWREPVNKKYLLQKLRYFPWKNYRYAFWFFKNLVKSQFTKDVPIWGPRYRNIKNDVENLSLHEVCAKQWSRCVDLADEQLALLDKDRVFKVRFEDLMADTKVLRELCDFIGIQDVDNVVQFFEKTVSRDNNVKSIQLLDKEAVDAIEKYASNSLLRLGYQK